MKRPIDPTLLKRTLLEANQRLLEKHGIANSYPTSDKAIRRIIVLLDDRSVLDKIDEAVGIDDDKLDDIQLLMSVADGSISQFADKIKSALSD